MCFFLRFKPKVEVDANTLKVATGTTPVAITAKVVGPDATQSELTVSAASISADNTTGSTINFIQKDAVG